VATIILLIAVSLPGRDLLPHQRRVTDPPSQRLLSVHDPEFGLGYVRARPHALGSGGSTGNPAAVEPRGLRTLRTSWHHCVYPDCPLPNGSFRIRDGDLFRSRPLGPMFKDGAGRKPFAHTREGRGADIQVLDNSVVSASQPAWHIIGQDRNSIMRQLRRHCRPWPSAPTQTHPCRRSHLEPINPRTSFPSANTVRTPVSKSIPDDPTSKFDTTLVLLPNTRLGLKVV
jgi:hypothetical protein